MSLSRLFNEEVHELEVGVDFGTGPLLDVKGFDEVDDDEELLPFETPTRIPRYEDSTPGGAPADDQVFWGTLAVALAPLCRILGGERKQYQHNQYDPSGAKLLSIRYTFQYVAGEAGWTGERF